MYRGYTCLWRKVWSNPILAEPGKRFSRFEAWLYITNVLASGKDDADAGLKRGEFVASIRFLAKTFNWSHAMAQRFIDQLLENSMITRVIHQSIHPAIQEAGHFIVCNYETYNSPRYAERNTGRYAERYKLKEVLKESKKNIKDKLSSAKPPADMPTSATAPAGMSAEASAKVDVSPKILLEIYQQNNQALPGVKALTSERLKKCRSRINQAVRDGCLEQYLADFTAAVQKAQQTPFLRGEGVHGWRASFDWFVANQLNIYKVLEGKYDGPTAGPNHGGVNGNGTFNSGGSCPQDAQRQGTVRRTSRGDPIYVPRQ
jgi:hypothetical protein